MGRRDMIRELEAFKRNTRGVIHGIDRRYYPKFLGWKMIEEGCSAKELEDVAEEFYKIYYYYNLKLDLLEDQELARVLLIFAVDNGKAKCIDKVKLVAGTMEYLNVSTKEVRYKLLLELIEFYYYIGNYSKCTYLMEYYRAIS